MKNSLQHLSEFTVHTVLYNREGFVIAFGKWGDKASSLAMKWENSSTEWFPLPCDKLFTKEMVKGIMQAKSQHKKESLSF